MVIDNGEILNIKSQFIKTTLKRILSKLDGKPKKIYF
jgi:hypothetical protein